MDTHVCSHLVWCLLFEGRNETAKGTFVRGIEAAFLGNVCTSYAVENALSPPTGHPKNRELVPWVREYHHFSWVLSITARKIRRIG